MLKNAALKSQAINTSIYEVLLNNFLRDRLLLFPIISPCNGVVFKLGPGQKGL